MTCRSRYLFNLLISTLSSIKVREISMCGMSVSSRLLISTVMLAMKFKKDALSNWFILELNQVVEMNIQRSTQQSIKRKDMC